jgi:hypothetical protein
MAKKSKKSAKKRTHRANPSGGQVAKGTAMIAAGAVLGAVVTYGGSRLLNMKAANGAPRLSVRQQTIGKGVVALGLAAGSAAVSSPKVKGALAASALVMGGQAVGEGLYHTGLQQRADAALGLQPSANPVPVAPGAYLPSGDAMPYYMAQNGAFVRG